MKTDAIRHFQHTHLYLANQESTGGNTNMSDGPIPLIDPVSRISERAPPTTAQGPAPGSPKWNASIINVVHSTWALPAFISEKGR